MPGSRAVSLWLPVVVWAAVIFLFSSIPSLGTGLGVWDTILRKGAHMTEYAILGLLLLRAIGRELPALALGSRSDEAFAPKTVYNIDASAVIAKLEGASGAHNDLAHRELSWLGWHAALSRAMTDR